jgi:hypothetical protein
VKQVVIVARFSYRYQAEFAKQILTGAGIRAALFADDAAGMYAGMTFANPARLVVHRRDEAEAKRVLRDHGVLDVAHEDEASFDEAEAGFDEADRIALENNDDIELGAELEDER